MNKLLLIGALLACAFSCLYFINTANVQAVGAPTENYTVPDSPLDDPQAEITPHVNWVQTGVTALPAMPPPAFSLEFSEPAGQEKYSVTGDGTWYLFIDINTAGWLYIYEDYPPGGTNSGKWLAYKWQLPQGGLWRLGPFIAAPAEPEGQHVYRAWFYGEGQWAVESPQNNPITWTYTKSSLIQTPPITPPAPPVTGHTPAADAMRFFSHPAVLLATPTLIILLSTLAVYLVRRYRKPLQMSDEEPVTTALETEEPIEQPAIPAAATIVRAAFILPNGTEIKLTTQERVIGRTELARALGLDELGLISRRHFRITHDGQSFYVEDAGSANGTHLNGEDIAGRGAQLLKDNDFIELPGAVRLKFREV